MLQKTFRVRRISHRVLTVLKSAGMLIANPVLKKRHWSHLILNLSSNDVAIAVHVLVSSREMGRGRGGGGGVIIKDQLGNWERCRLA